MAKHLQEQRPRDRKKERLPRIRGTGFLKRMGSLVFLAGSLAEIIGVVADLTNLT